jgi:copper transport protein
LCSTLERPRLAFAHANYVRSAPEAEASLQQPPVQVQVWFSEAVQMPGSELAIFDAEGTQVASSEARTDPNDDKSLIVSMEPLPHGVYFVRWQTLSTVDGHRTQGSFPFSVGVAAPVAGFGPLVRQVEQVTTALQPPPMLDTIIRSLVLIALMLVSGGFAFSPLVLTSQSVQPLRISSAPLRRRVLWVSLIFACVLFALAFIARLAQSDVISALTSRSGLMFAIRIALLIILAAMLWRNRHESPLALLPCAALALTQSLLSHSAGEPEWGLPTLADWAHTFTAAIWLGGVAMLAIITPLALATQAFKELGAAILRFSPIAMFCALILALTGIVQAAGFVGSFDALINTAYGRALLVKLILFVVLIGFGAFHQYVVSPRLNAWRASAISLAETARRFRVSILAEAGAGALILFAAGAMTALPPARDFTASTSDTTTHTSIQTQQVNDMMLTLGAMRDALGPHQFVLRLTDASGSPIEKVEKAVLRTTHTTMDMGESEILLQPYGNGNFVAQSSKLSMSGDWQVEAIVRRANLPDTQTEFALHVQ